MAYLRIEKKKSGSYMRIIQGYRKDGKSLCKTLYNLGRLEDYKSTELQAIGQKFLKLAGCPIENIKDLGLRELARYNYGYIQIVNSLWNTFKINEIIAKTLVSKRIKYDFVNVLKLMLAERLNVPCSKLQTFHNQSEYIGIQPVALENLYRSLDILSQAQNEIQAHFFNLHKNVFSSDLSVVFYDVTTLYFDVSMPVDENDIRQKGWSKDGKHKKLQVVLGILVDKFRNPLTYRIYRGDTYEGHTFSDVVNKLKNEYQLSNLVIVADSGMLMNDNIEQIKKSNYEYIVGDRLKSLTKEAKKYLTDKSNYTKLVLGKDDESNEICIDYVVYPYKGRTIVCTWSAKRAKKDAHEREQLKAKAMKYVEKPSLLEQHSAGGAKKYLKIETSKIELNVTKIEEDARYDGFKAIATNIENPNVKQLLEQYSNLFEVEHAFRTMKSHLEIRPMFHWTGKRIEGHLSMCFIAYTLLNRLRLQMNWSEQKCFSVLNKMQVSLVEQKFDGSKLYLRSAMNEDTELLISKMRLNKLNDTVPYDLIMSNI